VRCPHCGSACLEHGTEWRCHNDACTVNIEAQRDFDRAQTIVVVVRFLVRAFVAVALVGGALYFAAWVTALDTAYYGGSP
jgi:uncharacterized protein (DUF983 family)